MIEKARKKILDKGATFGAPFTGLSKTFDCMTYDHALNFDMNALNLIFDYLTGRVKINSSFSSYLVMFQGVPRKDQF